MPASEALALASEITLSRASWGKRNDDADDADESGEIGEIGDGGMPIDRLVPRPPGTSGCSAVVRAGRQGVPQIPLMSFRAGDAVRARRAWRSSPMSLGLRGRVEDAGDGELPSLIPPLSTPTLPLS